MIFEGPLGRTVRLGFKSLMLHKLRSALTTLGIMFGVLSVVAMLSIGEGASYEAQQQIKALGSNSIILESRKPPELEGEQQSNSMFRAQAYGLTYADADAIAATLPAVRVVVPVREIPKLARQGERSLSVPVFGTVPRYSGVTGTKLREGRFLSRRDLERKHNVAVLGSTVAETLYPFEDPIGKPIRIGKESFRVVGVLETPASSNASKAATRAMEGILVPLSAARSFFGELTVKRSAGSREFEFVQLHRIQVQLEGSTERISENVIATAGALRSLMKNLHDKEDYSIVVPLELLRQAEKTTWLWNLVLGCIAGISLLVGGIGIMNVMLATVTERTREIGIRRALGAKRRHIVAQFLVETVVLSCGGGLLGILVGVAIPFVVEKSFGLKTIVDPKFPALAFGISALVGVVFGMYPAWRAARMEPVDALRHE